MKISQIILIFFLVSYALNTATMQKLIFPEQYWTKQLNTAIYTVQVDREMLEEARLAGNAEDMIMWNDILIMDQADVLTYKDELFQRGYNP